MTIALSRDVEAFVEEQIRAGVCPDASTLVNDVLRSLSEDGRRSFAVTPELEAWLLQAADGPTSPLTSAAFDGIRERARTVHPMTNNDLLQEIHRVREKLARECDYDVHKIGERMRQSEREEKARGVRYVSFAPPRGTEAESCVVREEPHAE